MKVTKKQMIVSLAVVLFIGIISAALMIAKKGEIIEKEATPIESKKDVGYIPEKKVEEEKPEPKKEISPKVKKGILKQEIRTMAKYIKFRNSKIPTEIADLQAEIIVTLSAKNKVNISLINGIIEKESLYDPTSVSKSSAKGLMQILKCDGIDIDPNKAHDLTYNIEKGIAILQEKIKKADGNLTSGLNNYSGGAKDYSTAVYANIGRYTMFKEKEEMDNSLAMVE